MQPAWPFLTSDVPPLDLVLRRYLEDFQVEELPAYDPCGSGDHVHAYIEKVGVTTRHTVIALARALRIPARRIGVAGQKDARGIARQFVSLEGVDPSRVLSLDLPRLRILGVARHRARIRLGFLRGNRFLIRLRDVPRGRVEDVGRVLGLLGRRGVPNYFGA